MPDAGPDFRKFRIRKAAADFRRSFGRGAAQSCSLTNHAMALWQTTAFEPCRKNERYGNLSTFHITVFALRAIPTSYPTLHGTGKQYERSNRRRLVPGGASLQTRDA